MAEGTEGCGVGRFDRLIWFHAEMKQNVAERRFFRYPASVWKGRNGTEMLKPHGVFCRIGAFFPPKCENPCGRACVFCRNGANFFPQRRKFLVRKTEISCRKAVEGVAGRGFPDLSEGSGRAGAK